MLTGTAADETLTLDFTGHVVAAALGGNDTIIGPNQAVNWEVDAGTFSASSKSAAFTGFETLQGGSGADTFALSADAPAVLKGGLGDDVFDLAATLTGSIHGEGGSDTLRGTAIDASTRCRVCVATPIVVLT